MGAMGAMEPRSLQTRRLFVSEVPLQAERLMGPALRLDLFFKNS